MKRAFFKLQGRELVPADGVVDWGRWFETANDRVLADDMPFLGVRVTTVCIGFDRDHGLHHGRGGCPCPS